MWRGSSFCYRMSSDLYVSMYVMTLFAIKGFMRLKLCSLIFCTYTKLALWLWAKETGVWSPRQHKCKTHLWFEVRFCSVKTRQTLRTEPEQVQITTSNIPDLKLRRTHKPVVCILKNTFSPAPVLLCYQGWLHSGTVPDHRRDKKKKIVFAQRSNTQFSESNRGATFTQSH